MPRSRTLRSPQGGFTLVELLIAMVMLIAVTGAAYSLFQSQTTSFRKNTERYDLTQNVRSALESAGRVVRTMGAGVAPGQPMLVYGANTVLAFNSDHVERDTVEMRWAAYWNPDAPLAETVVWPVAAAAVLPNSSPSFTYPDSTYRMGNGALSPAETYVLWFEPDADTPRADDFVLRQRVNAGTAEILARGILPHPNGRPFFEYLLHRVLPGGDTLLVANGAMLPLIRRHLIPGISTADSAARVRPDSVRAVRMHLRVTNGLTGTDERFRDVSTTIDTPNNGIALPTICGRAPIQPASFGVTDTIPGSGIVWLTWTPSVDEAGGEQDVRQYVVWRRLATQPAWAEPLLIVKASPGTASYTSEVSGNLAGTAYVFGVAAQDCTPTFSTVRTVAITTSITP